jgi:hypothetical protein
LVGGALLVLGGCAAPPSPPVEACLTEAPRPRGAAVAEVRQRLLGIVDREWRETGGTIIIFDGASDQPLLSGDGPSENDPRMFNRLAAYWRSVGRFDLIEREAARVQAGLLPRWDEPWSAAFVSWAMAEAGVPRTEFCPHQAHWSYLRLAAAREGWFRPANLDEGRPRSGDLVCATRAGARATGWRDALAQPRPLPLHCDVVVAVGQNWLAAVGGNVADTVAMTLTPLDQSGLLRPVPGRAWFMRLVNGYPAPADRRDPATSFAVRSLVE